MHSNKEFISLKNSKGQINHNQDANKVDVENDVVGFKCLHYSVSESNGTVEITILKKSQANEISFGVRTVADTAISPKDYEHFD